MKGFKVKLHPTKEQEKMFHMNFGASRFAYNWALEKQKSHYDNGGKFIYDAELRRMFTQFKKEEGNEWLYDVINNTTKQAIKDLCKSYKAFFKGVSKHPKFKSKRKSKNSFYHDTVKIKFTGTHVKLEKIGFVKLAEKDRIPTDCKYFNPRITFDGINYWISLTCDVDENQVLTQEKTSPIGIDLGLKTLAVCSNGEILKKVNITKEQKRLKRLQKRASKQYDLIKKKKINSKSNRLKKLEKKILKQHQRITNLLDNNIHQFTSKIVNLNPSHIVLEDLNVTGMMKNKHLSEKIAKAKFYELRRQFEYKSERKGIKLIFADRWYPSSKLCSCCGHKKEKLSLSERLYVCDECGIEIDRDFNASLNLQKLAM